jgi:DNA-binding response OmpR family regulator
MNVLILEDDPLFAETLEDFLDEEGFSIVVVHTVHDALTQTYETHFDAYLFDINLPDGNGVETLEQLRGAGDNTPTMYITSYQDKAKLAEAFEAGGDDYLVKPLDLDELLWRLKALLKRTQKSERICWDGICFEPTNHTLHKEDETTILQPKESELLLLLYQNRGSIVTKEVIFSHVWSVAQTPSYGSLRIYINRLKGYIGEAYIENIRGVGYRLNVQK